MASSSYINRVLQLIGRPSLIMRDYQRKLVESYIEGKDVFVCAPTGSGKSLTYEVAPHCFDFHRFGHVREQATTVRTVSFSILE